jgi:tubulin-folding cofactor B
MEQIRPCPSAKLSDNVLHSLRLLSSLQINAKTNNEIKVTDTRPPGARVDFNDVSSVEKYVMPSTEYEARGDSVLAWKKKQQLGRFDPNAPSLEQQKILALEREVEERGITLNARCQLLPGNTDGRRGVVLHIGAVPEIPGGAGPWIGIALDEPTGKNDGSITDKATGEKRVYFECKPKHGVFVRPERVEVGAFPSLDDELGGSDMEEM